ncbi:D-amino-acid dehydrogenase [Roseivivax marinus]|uniref:NAD(P)/FAD-dependent oxidoreductase n=1 Tax=Roseivivax marinus TaxID=1379903 RepID=UPI0008D8015C|nr:FAD-dependent oxidoreductase [Roseivivax marinus]SEK71273.1 D-amino-acid dehydrogenase [Roseivivax marinus]
MTEATGRHIAVIGGGIMGVSAAEALLRDGHKVTMIEPGTFGGPQAASFGNGAFLSPASNTPVSMPGLWAKVPGYLRDREGPLTIRWAHLPRLAPWLLRFLAAGWTEARVTRTAAALGALLDDAAGRHSALAARVGAPDLIRREGLIYLYRDRAAYEAEALAWGLRRDAGVRADLLEGEALAARVPGLSPDYRFGVLLHDGGHCTEPGAYVAAIADWCLAQGMSHVGARAIGLRTEGGHVRAVRTETDDIPCDGAVVTAGVHSGALVRACGDRVPMEAERGYHIELTEGAPDLQTPVMPQDLKVAITRTRTGLRVAGQVELASTSTAPDWRRADLLRRALLECFPGLGTDPDALTVTRWQGNRPSPADGVPVIGPARVGGVTYAFGHGHFGLVAAPMTAALVADMVAGRAPAIDASPFSVARFRRSGRTRRSPAHHARATATAHGG